MNLQHKILDLVKVHGGVNEEVIALEKQLGLLLIGYTDGVNSIGLRECKFGTNNWNLMVTKIKGLALDKSNNLWYIGNVEDFIKDSEEAFEEIEKEINRLLEEINEAEKKYWVHEMVEELDREYGLKQPKSKIN